ncbi:hypothetical protein FNF27_06475 [Cafeteria roenbergensis]|uniref:Uncharacterized protein n=1 Tax=Cafeteria roenbergensis TaxID=33653 RepID=A0A5A8DD67_CAFRO|nr:hypothetical protein FNF29_06474 [Cafeteria roenbergensis]KAA0162487.1 hypothetical protein FNF31_03285 [Cafeteria roenbergensis]KAA0170777.1 hypothetical protein FNF27_06475 [Cafeteria roenbergensis]|eukprot:KAA0148691.1 hypothetical protein FNF29_06474 [Cafeteria roenbergensis]
MADAIMSAAAAMLPECVAPWLATPMGELAVWDVLGTVAVFLLSVASGNSSWYDPYWSVVPPIAVVWLALKGGLDVTPSALMEGDGGAWRLVVVTAIIWAWAYRLTANWIRRLGAELVSTTARHGLRAAAHCEEDWRYKLIRTWFCGMTPVYWVLGSLGIIHLFPTAMVFAGMLPLQYVTGNGGEVLPLGWLDAAGAALGVWGIFLEHSADTTMDRFLAASRPGPDGFRPVCREGLWGASRHPNYLGELAFWASIGCFGAAAGGADALWTLYGFAAMVALFVAASIPLMEARSAKRRAGWRSYASSTAMLLPLSPRLLVSLLPGAAACARRPAKAD